MPKREKKRNPSKQLDHLRRLRAKILHLDEMLEAYEQEVENVFAEIDTALKEGVLKSDGERGGEDTEESST